MKPTLLAVADFHSPDGSASAQCHYLAWYLSSSIQEHGKKKLQVADHREFDKELNSIFGSSPVSTTPEAIHDVAPRIGADIVITGSVIKRDDSYFFDITPVRAASGTTMETLKSSMKVSEFLESLFTPFPAKGIQVVKPGMDGIGIPKCVHCPDPFYTDLARANKVQGITVLELIISPDGQVEQLRSIKLLGYGLDQSAYDTLKTWKFNPIVDKQGHPRTVMVPVEVSFRLY